jgi:hypothetical protein
VRPFPIPTITRDLIPESPSFKCHAVRMFGRVLRLREGTAPGYSRGDTGGYFASMQNKVRCTGLNQCARLGPVVCLSSA